MSVQVIMGVVAGLLILEGISLMTRKKIVFKNIDISLIPLRVMLLGLLLGISIVMLIEEKDLDAKGTLVPSPELLTTERTVKK